MCTSWNDFANEIARMILYRGSKIEVSTLVYEIGGFQHYEGDSLYPLFQDSDIGVFSSYSHSLLANGSQGQRLIWLREGNTTHRWTSFLSPENMWPNVIKYQSSKRSGFRLDYDFEFSPVDGGDRVFIRQPPPMLSLTSRRADWRVRVKVNHDGDESLAAVSIPLWQLVQISLNGSVFGENVEELSMGEDNETHDSHSYYVWTAE